MKISRTQAIKVAIVFSAIAALTLTGCGRTSNVGVAPTASIDSAPATGTINFWAGGSGGGEGDVLPGYLKQFESANPGVKVNVTSIPSGDFDAKLTAAITAGSVPDVVFLYSQTQSTLFNTGGFAAVPTGLVNPSSFFKSAYDSTLVDGVSYAVPWYTYALTFYYRTDLAQKAGVEAPKTWQDLKSFAKALKAEGVEFPIALDVAYDVYTTQDLLALSAQNGGSFLSKDNKSWTINSSENVEALDYWGSLIKDGYASPDGPGFLDTVPWFGSGKIAAITTGPWFPGFLDGAKGKGWSAKNMGAALVPAGPAGSISNVAGGSLAVLKDAKNSDAAWKLVRWMSTPKAQSDWYDLFGNLPAVKGAWDINPTIQSDPLLKAVKEAIPTGVTGPQVPTWAQVASIIGQQMERVARGTATAKEALDEAQSRAETIGTGVK